MTAPADAPISPELVLVASPEEAELARRSLPLPVPPMPRFPTFPPAAVRARARRAERSWTYAVAAAAVVAFAIAAAVVLNRSSDGATPTARHAATQPTATQPATPAKPAPRPTTTTAATAPARTTSAPTTRTQTTSTTTAPTTPTKTTKSAAPKGFVPSRVFAWPAKADAVAYVIRFFRDNKLVFERRVDQPRITLPESFDFAPGSYRWLVVPVDRRGNEGSALVASAFDVG